MGSDGLKSRRGPPTPPPPQWRGSRPPRRRKQSVCHSAPILALLLLAVALGAAGWFWWRKSEVVTVADMTTASAGAPFAEPATSGPLDRTVYERGLVTRRTSAAEILREHAGFYHNVTRRVSPGRVLGFVSPWSRRGDEAAWRFASKLTHLSPLMYSVDADGALRAAERGSWLETLRVGLACPGCPPPARLVPHVSLRELNFSAFFNEEDGEERAGRLLFALLQQAVTRDLDGFVLDAHAHLALLPPAERRRVAPRLHVFVQLLAQQLSQQAELRDAEAAKAGGKEGAGPMELYLLVPPHVELFSPTQLAQLIGPLGGIIVSTANYSSIRGAAGPTAPLHWTRAALAALQPEEHALPKLLATLPMSGWDFTLPSGPDTPIGADEYLELLRRHRPHRLDWYSEAAEHVFSYNEPDGWRHSVYYPTLKSIAERIGALRTLGVGVAVWELGTGLDYFWDLL